MTISRAKKGQESRSRFQDLSILFLFIIVIASVIIVTRSQRDLNAARDRINSLGSQVLEINCVTIEYLSVGEGYPMLVVHGLSKTGDSD